MTTIEYSYTETDIYRAIVQTAVPIALTEHEELLILKGLLSLAEEMRLENPASVFYNLAHEGVKRQRACTPLCAHRVPFGECTCGRADEWPSKEDWRAYVDQLTIKAARAAVLARQAAEYPSLKGGQ